MHSGAQCLAESRATALLLDCGQRAEAEARGVCGGGGAALTFILIHWRQIAYGRLPNEDEDPNAIRCSTRVAVPAVMPAVEFLISPLQLRAPRGVGAIAVRQRAAGHRPVSKPLQLTL